MGEHQHLIVFLMKENTEKKTALHHASEYGYEEIVSLLINAFGGETANKKLIEFVMKENQQQKTALHGATQKGYNKIINFLLNVFGEEESEKLIEFVMKEDADKNTCLHYASQKDKENKFSQNSYLGFYDCQKKKKKEMNTFTK